MNTLSVVVLVAALAGVAQAGLLAAPVVYSSPVHTVHGLSLPHPIYSAAPSYIQYSPAIAKVHYAAPIVKHIAAPVVYHQPIVKTFAAPIAYAAPVHQKLFF